MYDQRTPPAADIQQTLFWPNLNLVENAGNFLKLGSAEVFVAIFEVGACIDHVLVEPQLIKFVRDIIVMFNGFLVGCFGVDKVSTPRVVVCCRLARRSLRGRSRNRLRRKACPLCRSYLLHMLRQGYPGSVLTRAAKPPAL